MCATQQQQQQHQQQQQRHLGKFGSMELKVSRAPRM
jgi:hypothetical protein